MSPTATGKGRQTPSIKLPMVADLSHLQSAQDDLVKPSTSSTLNKGKFLASHHTRAAGTVWWCLGLSLTNPSLASEVGPGYSPAKRLGQTRIHVPQKHEHSLFMSLCLSHKPSGLGSRCPQHPMGKPGCICFSSHYPFALGCTKTSISSVQDNLQTD